MPTQTKENYLKALHFLHQKAPEISISELGKALDVSKPTVNDMVKKLQRLGWVEYERYRPLKLSKKGELMAALVIRKHRLAEMFLTQIMGFGWEEVHDMAEEIEHLKHEKFFDRMDELLGFPTVDPHGSPIPDKSGNFTSSGYVVLHQIAEGQTITLRALRDSSTDFLLYLNKKDLRLGTMLKVIHKEDFDKSMTLQFASGNEIVLSHSVCSRLLVDH